MGACFSKLAVDTGERLVRTWEGLQAQGSKPVKTGTCAAEGQLVAGVAGRGETLLLQ